MKKKIPIKKRRILQSNQGMTLYNAKSRIWLWEMGDNVPKTERLLYYKPDFIVFQAPKLKCSANIIVT